MICLIIHIISTYTNLYLQKHKKINLPLSNPKNPNLPHHKQPKILPKLLKNPSLTPLSNTLNGFIINGRNHRSYERKSQFDRKHRARPQRNQQLTRFLHYLSWGRQRRFRSRHGLAFQSDPRINHDTFQRKLNPSDI